MGAGPGSERWMNVPYIENLAAAKNWSQKPESEPETRPGERHQSWSQAQRPELEPETRVETRNQAWRKTPELEPETKTGEDNARVQQLLTASRFKLASRLKLPAWLKLPAKKSNRNFETEILKQKTSEHFFAAKK